jgi:hypothetical protein
MSGGVAGNAGVFVVATDLSARKLLNMSLKPRSNYLYVSNEPKDGIIPGQGDESYISEVCWEFNRVSSCSAAIFEKNWFNDDASCHINGKYETNDP